VSGRPAPAIRRAIAADRDEVLRLLTASLGWVPDDLFDAFFSWKHETSPAGASPAWVALDDDGAIVGFRTFLRWDLETATGVRRRAVRAVDTATHPDHQGRGIFRALTVQAVAELTEEGVDLVFNTPNDKSRPGYLTMGWTQVGRLPTAVRPASLGALARMARSKVPAQRWSAATGAGTDAAELLADPRLAGLLDALAPGRGLRTRRTAEHLRWRYGFAPLRYRALALGGDPAQGVAVWRVRQRGAAQEVALCEVLAPGGDERARLHLEREVHRAAGGDYVIRLGEPRADRAGFVPLVGQGPVLARRALARDEGASLGDWDLALGDVELF
jgi:GNAT superfamily N-acetyltransferase